MINQKRQKGFTLIEILIVVAIIGLLSSIILVGLGSFRARGRDARRVADLRETQNALELYYAKNGSYPGSAAWSALSGTLTGAGIGVTAIPKDPLSGQNYWYGSNGQSYVLAAQLENNDTNTPPLSDDIDGSVFGINCGDPVYCIQF